MEHRFEVIDATGPVPESMARVEPPEREPFRVGAVQMEWYSDPEVHRARLADGIRIAAARGAKIVCLQELTLSPYFAITEDAVEEAAAYAEVIGDGPTSDLAREMAAETGAHVHASLYEKAEDGGIGFNTAICYSPEGELVARTRKLHIPITAGYYEDRYFRPGDTGYPVVGVGEARFGFPTCWDQWFPELARAYSLAGAEVIVYPTAIGSEPDHPDFDTEPLWERVIVGNGIANGTFMIAVNRIGTEGPLTFYGSSFISDPYGRVLVQASRYEDSVLIADLDLDQREDWLTLFPFLTTRRPDTYGPLASS
ncbi:MAG: hydrolase [Solirubrobacterales bacterium]|nr:hydrolase [Solirubrobacterales bacterium]